MTQIDYLAEHPEFIPVLAPAIAEYWRVIIPEETIESRIAKELGIDEGSHKT